ncbi:hypothetical protein RQP46_001496 [Phenoliferia psychrophenolica]
MSSSQGQLCCSIRLSSTLTPTSCSRLVCPNAPAPRRLSLSSPSHLLSPICGKKVPAFFINSHIDSSCGASAPRTALPSSSSSGTFPPSAPPPKRFKSSSALEDAKPLADRVRPSTLDDFVGQEKLLGPQGLLRSLVENDKIGSAIFWGPPGTGKTTLARVIAQRTQSVFKELSATNATTADLRAIFSEAQNVLKLTGKRTILFIDEIQRFSKSQQDNFLPVVEAGVVSLVASTTENPSFRLNNALLSRCRVFVLEKLTPDSIYRVLVRALAITQSSPSSSASDPSSSSPASPSLEGPIDEGLLRFLASAADGDARVALSSLELAITVTADSSTSLTTEELKAQLRKAHMQYDRSGDHHYDTISALHKSVRGGDANAALYWLARMLQGGDDPLFVARRLIRMASEDIGLANPDALPQAVAAYQATLLIGMPECDCILAQVVVMLAESPKSVRVYKAYNAAKAFVDAKEGYPVPIHIRNAPTGLMKSLGYGAEYKYNPGYSHPVHQTYLPPGVEATFLQPTDSLVGRTEAILVKDGVGATAKSLYFGKVPRPVPQDEQVLVKVYAFGLNRMDISQRMGHYPLPPGVSTILGVEFSGVVAESKSSNFKVGDEVFGLAFGGAYAEYIAVASGMVVQKPQGVSWIQAASIPENWLTAYQALFLIAEMKAGQSVMIHAGASGVGLAAIQLAKSFGAALVIATAGSDDKVKFIEQHGAKGINYKTQDFSAEVLKLTNGTGVNVVIDFVGPDYWTKNIASLARDGRMVLLGMLSGLKTKEPLDMGPLLFKRLRVEGTTLRSRSLEYQSNLLQEFTKNAMSKVFANCGSAGGEKKDGLDLVIHKVYSWRDIIDAHEEMEGAKNIGKIICTVVTDRAKADIPSMAAAVAYVASPAMARFDKAKRVVAYKDIAAAAQANCGPPGSVVTQYVTVTSTVYEGGGPAPTQDPNGGSPGGPPEPVVITVPNGQVVTVTEFVGPGPTPAPDPNSGNPSGVTDCGLSHNNGDLCALTLPNPAGGFSTITTTFPPNQPQPTASPSNPSPGDNGPTTITLPVTITETAPGSDPTPEVVTVTIPGSGGQPPQVLTITETAPGSQPTGPPGSPEVVTVTIPGSGGNPPQVVTITETAPGSQPTSPPGSPDDGNPTVITVTLPNGQPITITETAPAPEPTQPTSPDGPTVITVTMPNGQPITITETAPAPGPTQPTSPDGPTVITITEPGSGGSPPQIITLTETAPAPPAPTTTAPSDPNLITITKTLLAPSVTTVAPEGATVTHTVGPAGLTKTITIQGYPIPQTYAPGATITQTLIGGSTVTKTLPAGITITVTETPGPSPPPAIVTIQPTQPPAQVTITNPAPPAPTSPAPPVGPVGPPSPGTNNFCPSGVTAGCTCPPPASEGCGDGDAAHSSIEADIITTAFNIVTDLSANLTEVVKTLNIFNAFSVIISIVPGFTKIITTLTADVGALGQPGMAPVGCGDADAIVNALADFVEVHQNLLGVVIGKRGLLNTIPGLQIFVFPINAVLTLLEGIVDTVAGIIIGFIPSRACIATQKVDALKASVQDAIQAFTL